jgi:hypothetical protein
MDLEVCDVVEVVRELAVWDGLVTIDPIINGEVLKLKTYAFSAIHVQRVHSDWF